jgi:hypothetical protein
LTIQNGLPIAPGENVEAGLDAMIHTRARQRHATENDQEGFRLVAEVGPEYLHGGAA